MMCSRKAVPGRSHRRLWKGIHGARALLVEIDADAGSTKRICTTRVRKKSIVASGVFNDGTRGVPRRKLHTQPGRLTHVPQTSTGCVLFVFYPEG